MIRQIEVFEDTPDNEIVQMPSYTYAFFIKKDCLDENNDLYLIKAFTKTVLEVKKRYGYDGVSIQSYMRIDKETTLGWKAIIKGYKVSGDSQITGAI